MAKTVTREEAAKILGCSIPNVIRIEKTGKLPGERRGKLVYYDREVLLKLKKPSTDERRAQSEHDDRMSSIDKESDERRASIRRDFAEWEERKALEEKEWRERRLLRASQHTATSLHRSRALPQSSAESSSGQVAGPIETLARLLEQSLGKSSAE